MKLEQNDKMKTQKAAVTSILVDATDQCNDSNVDG